MTTQLVSMKLSVEEAKAETMLGSSSDDDLPKYPYGLSICLDDDALEKLGITELPAVGSTMQLVATVEVQSVSQYENQKGADNNLNLQITDMALSVPTKRDPASMASSLYKS